MELMISVWLPGFWWRASSTHLNRLIPTDPKESDCGPPRWPDSHTLRWELIAQSIVLAGDEIAAGRWISNHPPTENYREIVIKFNGELSNNEIKLVRSWFKMSQCVRASPWDDTIQNGRHRGWATLPFYEQSPIPILASSLISSMQQETESADRRRQEHHARNMERLKEIKLFDRCDFLNAKFIANLAQAARGKFTDELAIGLY